MHPIQRNMPRIRPSFSTSCGETRLSRSFMNRARPSKVITTAMALEEGLVSHDEKMFCSGKFYVEGYSQAIHCHKRSGHGSVTFERGLQRSCRVPRILHRRSDSGSDSRLAHSITIFRHSAIPGLPGSTFPARQNPYLYRSTTADRSPLQSTRSVRPSRSLRLCS